MIADDISAPIGLELLKTIKRPVIWMQAPMIFSMAKFKRSAKCCLSSLLKIAVRKLD
jgi:hypothetical protein